LTIKDSGLGATCLAVTGAGALVRGAVAGLRDAADILAEERAYQAQLAVNRDYADAVSQLVCQEAMLRAQATAIARLEIQYHGERMYSRGLERRLAQLSRRAA
jgi:hypothetical protein